MWAERMAEQAPADTKKKPNSKVVFLAAMDKGLPGSSRR